DLFLFQAESFGVRDLQGATIKHIQPERLRKTRAVRSSGLSLSSNSCLNRKSEGHSNSNEKEPNHVALSHGVKLPLACTKRRPQDDDDSIPTCFSSDRRDVAARARYLCNRHVLASFAFCKRRMGRHCFRTFPPPGDGLSPFSGRKG